MIQSRETRIKSLDGLRGLAAVAVVATHLIMTFIPMLYMGREARQSGSGWMDSVARSPLFVFYSGMFAVFVFFTLSGFVLAQSARKSSSSFVMLVGRRSLRIGIPVIASTAFAYLLLILLPHAAQDLAQYKHLDWLGKQYAYGAGSFRNMVYSSTLGWIIHGGSYYNLVLWTMQIELFGSLCIYAVFRVFPQKLWNLLLVCIAAALLWVFPYGSWTHIVPFALGGLLAQAMEAGYLKPSRWGSIGVVGGLFLGGLPRAGSNGSLLEPVANIVRLVGSPYIIILSLGAVMLLAGIIKSNAATHFLSRPVPALIGRLSFPIYLLHFPMLGTILAWTWFRFEVHTVVTSSIVLTSYFIALLFFSYLLERCVDEPVIRILSRPPWK